MRWAPGISLAFLALSATAADEAAIRRQAAVSVSLLQKVGAQWRIGCISCHHQALPALALEAARSRGIPVDEALARTTSERTYQYLSDLDAAVQVHDIIDPAMSEGYSLLGAHAAGVPPNLATGAYARHIARFQRADGSWPSFDGRPPHSAGLFTATAVAARSVALYAPPQLEAEKQQRLARTRLWLAGAEPQSTEDLTFRLLGLLWTGAQADVRQPALRGLLEAQRSDGGWAQVPSMTQSDAYSTAQALVALGRAGSVAAGDAAFARGIEWLLKHQAADGSWLVKSRIHTPAPISPPYFESGFPYGHDQYVSCAATAWAVMALAEALPPVAAPARPRPLRGVAPSRAAWMEKALFGSAAEAAALNPALATPKGTTVLMMASDDPAKVRALLRKGANPRAIAKSGYDALMTAAIYPENRETLELLLAAGASPAAREGTKFQASALPLATFTGDSSMVQFLIDKGADPNRPFRVLGFDPVPPILIAASMEYGDLLRMFVARGVNVDQVDPVGMTSLSWAAILHKDAAVRTLLELGASLAVKDKFGLTPLEHAKAVSHSSPAAERLLTRRADGDLRSDPPR